MRTRWDTLPRRVKRPGMLAGGDGSTLSLDFTTMSSLDSRFTFSRASTSGSGSTTYINSGGLVTTATTNEPRFDYDPTTLAARGLLIEGSSANLLCWSEAFDTTGGTINWNWSALNVTRGTITLTDPRGASSTVIKIQETSATGIHAPLIVPSASSSTSYTASVFAKAAERSYLQLFDNGGSSANAMVNLSSGAIVSESTAGITVVTAMPNGWYRIAMRLTTGVSQTSVNFQLRLSTDGSTTSYAGTTGSGIYIWGAQLEVGSGASSYIGTGASTATRATDVMYMDGSNFAAVFPLGLSTYSIYYSGDITRSPATTQFTWLLRTGSAGAGSSRARGFVTTGSVIRVNTSVNDINGALTTTVNTPFKSAYGSATGDQAHSVNNGTSSAIYSATDTLSSFDATQVVFNPNADQFCHMRSLKIWPTRLPNATLQSLTA